jgi:hypothetical protein
MNDDSLPPELSDLEARLRARPNIEPVNLRQNVLSAVAAELATTPRWNLLYSAAASAAAMLLIVLNLSLISATHDEFSIRSAATAAQMTAELQALRQFESQPEGTVK